MGEGAGAKKDVYARVRRVMMAMEKRIMGVKAINGVKVK
jgi:hypothetical protein